MCVFIRCLGVTREEAVAKSNRIKRRSDDCGDSPEQQVRPRVAASLTSCSPGFSKQSFINMLIRQEAHLLIFSERKENCSFGARSRGGQVDWRGNHKRVEGLIRTFGRLVVMFRTDVFQQLYLQLSSCRGVSVSVMSARVPHTVDSRGPPVRRTGEPTQP